MTTTQQILRVAIDRARQGRIEQCIDGEWRLTQDLPMSVSTAISVIRNRRAIFFGCIEEETGRFLAGQVRVNGVVRTAHMWITAGPGAPVTEYGLSMSRVARVGDGWKLYQAGQFSQDVTVEPIVSVYELFPL